MHKNCKICKCELTEETAAKAYSKSGKFRAICRKCRSQQTINYRKDNIEKARAYMRGYIRKIGKVKEYPCETCGNLCYKKYRRAFCKDLCRFLFYVDKTEDCWLWKGGKDEKGYGKISMTSLNKKSISAHRMSYILFKGPIDEGMLVCHQCDVPSCVKPAHLWLGTHNENMIDMVEKDRQASKLKALDVYKIRELNDLYECSERKLKEYSTSKLAEKYNIDDSTISNIIARRIWKHI